MKIYNWEEHYFFLLLISKIQTKTLKIIFTNWNSPRQIKLLLKFNREVHYNLITLWFRQMQIARLSKSYVINNYIIALNIKHIYPSIKFKSIEEKIKEFQKNFSIFEARKTSFPRMNRRAEGRSERMWNKEEGRIRESSGKKFRDALFPRGQCRMSCSCRRLNRNWINQGRGLDSYLNVGNGSNGLQLTGIIVAL